MGSRSRRRLCVLNGQVSGGCVGDRFDQQACFERDCPIVEEMYDCCQVLSVQSDGEASPLDGAYFVSDTDRFGNLKYRHESEEWFIFKKNEKWTIGSQITSISQINEAILTYHGTRGRTHCPTGVKTWFRGMKKGKPFLENHKVNLTVECGLNWSDWTKCDKTSCGDSFVYRYKVDVRGKYIKETANCGAPCDECHLRNNGDMCDTFLQSGFCEKESMANYMKKNCPRSCCYFTHDFSYQ